MPDLRRAAERVRPAVESTLADTCTIQRDAHREVDDVLDPDTLVLAPPAGDLAAVYEGACSIVRELDPRRHDEAGRSVARRRYHVRIPATAAAVNVGDRFTLTASTHGWPLVGVPMVVTDTPAASFATSRILVVEEQTGEAR